MEQPTEQEIKMAKDGHKKFWTSFHYKATNPIVVAGALPTPIDGISTHPDDNHYWACYKWEDVKNDQYLYDNYKKMLHNFELERDVFNDEEGFARIWIFYCSTINPGFQLTGKFYPCGMVGLQEKEELNCGYPTYSMAWINPIFRGSGICKRLFHYLAQKGVHLIEPPVSTKMTFALNAGVELLDKGEVDHLRDDMRKYLSKRHKIDLKDFSNHEFEKLATIVNITPNDRINQNMVDSFKDMIRTGDFADQVADAVKDFPKMSKTEVLKQLNKLSNLKVRGEI